MRNTQHERLMTLASRARHDKHGRRNEAVHSCRQVRKSSCNRNEEADYKEHGPKRRNSPGKRLHDAERSELVPADELTKTSLT
jgi:hypothetical protein